MSKISEILKRFNDLSDPLDPTSDEQLAAFEAEIGYQLPEDYREFLLLHNGGVIHFRNRYRGFCLKLVFGLADDDIRDLRWNRSKFSYGVPNDWLAIAYDFQWYYVCISLRPRLRMHLDMESRRGRGLANGMPRRYVFAIAGAT